MVCFLRVGQPVRQPILARLGRLDLLAGLALRVGVELPGLHGLLDRLVLVVVGDAEQGQFALALDRLLVERLGAEAGLDGVAGAVVAAVEPGEDLERLAGHQHVPVPTMVRRDSSTTSAVMVYSWSWSPCSSLAGSVSMGTFTVPSAPMSTSFSSTTSGGVAAARPTRRAWAACSPSRPSRDTRRSRRRTTSSRGRRTSPSRRADTSRCCSCCAAPCT